MKEIVSHYLAALLAWMPSAVSRPSGLWVLPWPWRANCSTSWPSLEAAQTAQPHPNEPVHPKTQPCGKNMKPGSQPFQVNHLPDLYTTKGGLPTENPEYNTEHYFPCFLQMLEDQRHHSFSRKAP